MTTNALKRIGILANHVSASTGSGRLDGKVCIVTGAGSGIGRASASAFAKQGARVVCSDINQDGLDETIKMIKDQGFQQVRAIVCDTSKHEQVEQLVEFCVKEFGGVDVCFANAGVVGFGSFMDQDPDELERIFKVNVIGVFNCFKSVAQRMVDAGTSGSLIATASVAGVKSGAGDMAYSASKAAVINMCETIANQLTGKNIRCNAICPGLIETGMTKVIFDIADSKGNRSKVGQLNPLLRYGHPDEIANVALFLASDESSYVNGQAIRVCGGLTSSLPVARRGYLRYG
mmetsp:Transcript_5476/g.8475  ORF Transcript_5476/g.8475 Transcript_5476/m.8475 type:complete len:289 (-) Transcript_5476:36-902(-)